MGNDFAKVYSMYFFYVISHVFGWTLSTLYYIQKGYSAFDIALYFGLSFIVSAAVVLSGGLEGRRGMQAGMLLKMVVFILAIFAAYKPVFFLIGAIWGIMTIYFWLPLNIKFFLLGKEGKNAEHSGMYFLMWPLLGALLPVFSGAVAEKYGMNALFLAGAALLVPGILIAGKINYKDWIKFEFKKYIEKTKGIKTMMLLQGIAEGVEWVVVPFATVAFVTSEVEYGAFYSYLGLFGLVAFLIMARVSDRIKKRAIFLVPISAILGIFTILSATSANLTEWAAYRGIASFFGAMFSPFALTVVVDLSKSISDSMISREFFLNSGRAIGAVAVAAIAFFSGDVKLAFLVSGAGLLLYPVILLRKRKHYSVNI